MNNFTLLETILIIYIIVVYVLGIIMLFVAGYAPKKVGEITFIIWFGVALPIALPLLVYYLTFDKWEHRKRKQDLEKQFDDMIKENEK